MFRLSSISSIEFIRLSQELEVTAAQMLQDNSIHISTIHELLRGMANQQEVNTLKELDSPEVAHPCEPNVEAPSTRLDKDLKVCFPLSVVSI